MFLFLLSPYKRGRVELETQRNLYYFYCLIFYVLILMVFYWLFPFYFLQPGDLTITMHASSKCRNFKVHLQNNEYHIGQKVFSNVETLIQHYRTHPIYKSDSERLFLTDPFQYKTPLSSFWLTTDWLIDSQFLSLSLCLSVSLSVDRYPSMIHPIMIMICWFSIV